MSSEVHGAVAIAFKSGFTPDIEPEEEVDYAAIFEAAEIDTDIEFEFFLAEEVDSSDNYLIVTTFGGDWIKLCQIIMRDGKNVEIYGSFVLDNGGEVYIGLNKAGEKYEVEMDYENSEEGDAEEQNSAWEGFVPEEVIDAFDGRM